jgi:phosphopantetheine adenylyltransferase
MSHIFNSIKETIYKYNKVLISSSKELPANRKKSKPYNIIIKEFRYFRKMSIEFTKLKIKNQVDDNVNVIFLIYNNDDRKSKKFKKIVRCLILECLMLLLL